VETEESAGVNSAPGKGSMNIRRRQGSSTLLLIICLLFANACSRIPTKPEAQSPDFTSAASLEELVDRINRPENQPEAIKASLVMGLQAHADQPIRYCRGHMLLSAQRELYLEGHRPLLPTFFTLVSNGTEFWLFVPRDNTVYTGLLEAESKQSRDYGIDLNLRDLFRALFPCPIEKDRLVELEAGDPYDVLSISDAAGTGKKLCRRLWVGKKGYRVEREKYYDAGGAEELEIHRSDFLGSACCLFPKVITLRSSSTGSAVSLTFHEITMNPEGLESSFFHFEVPEGAAVKSIE
jgi:outer membrane lipoprotein-sorting protein